MTDETATPIVKAKSSKTRKPVTFSSIHVKFASAKAVDVTRAAKLNRSYIRSNFDALVKVWPELKQSQKQNRDNNRYPATIPAKVADMIVKRQITSVK